MNINQEHIGQQDEHQKDTDRMKELVQLLGRASKAYYQDDTEIMSNRDYDRLYDELQALEAKTGMVYADSPSLKVGYEAVDELPKEQHESPMLSLDKTKDREALREWLNGREALLSWQLDGLTIVLTYRAGELYKAVTRGNGEVGEVITNNARVFKNLPLHIPYSGELILRGEAVITYADFAKINEEIEDAEAKYKNPRNLCSGSVRQLNNEITAKRNVQFYAFSLVKADGAEFHNARSGQLEFLRSQGFSVVEYKRVNEETILDAVQSFADAVQENEVPSDGLVLLYEDIEYGRSLGTTAKFPRDSIAFKWADELRETRLLSIEWSPSRTGLINPVAIFESVELEGTTVSRASVHNISIMDTLQLGIGDTITVYKANMIIPQIAENLTRSGLCDIPKICPACNGATEVKHVGEVQTLYCINPDCPAKKIKAFALLVSRNALNIDGLSEATLEKFIGMGLIHEFADIFKLEEHREQIVTMEGFGERSYTNLLNSIEAARHTTLPRLIYGIGILNVGLANAKMICKELEYDPDRVQRASVEELSAIDGVGEVIARSVTDYFANEPNRISFMRLCHELVIEKPEADYRAQSLQGLTFVITGSVEHYANRDELKEAIEQAGGKATGSVTAKTNYLINNDTTSGSSKNKKAKELGVPIISEDELIQMLNQG